MHLKSIGKEAGKSGRFMAYLTANQVGCRTRQNVFKFESLDFEALESGTI